jgi:hypothetical protein
MPAFQYWLSVPALFLAGSFALTVVLAFIGINNMISTERIVALLGVSLLLMLVGWMSAAKQEEQSAKRDTDAAAMRDAIKSIAATLGIGGYASVDDLKARVAEADARSRRQFLELLTRNFILSHDGIPSQMLAGLQLPPQDWLNEQLEIYGKRWRVRNVQGPTFEIYEVGTQ